MKNKLLTILTTITILILNPFAYANDPCCASNWYVSTSGPVAWHNNTKVHTPIRNVNIDYEMGWGAAASIGYIFDTCNQGAIRIEGEIVYRKSKINEFNVTTSTFSGPLPIEGDYQDIAFMTNLIADIPLSCDFSFYLGGGIGTSLTKLKLSIPDVNFNTEANERLFAWQILTGLSYWICPNVALTGGYRLFATSKPKNSNNSEFEKIPLTQNIDIGLRFRL